MNAFDPVGAQLAVFSDGNHHMALAECVETFVRRSPGLHEVFYTPPPERLPDVAEGRRAEPGQTRCACAPTS